MGARGTLTQSDEYWHDPVSDAPGARESYYFDFHDPDAGLSGYTSIGYRHNKRYMGVITALLDEDGSYVRKAYGRPTDDESIGVDGVLYRPIDPLQEWRVQELGSINRFDHDAHAKLKLGPDDLPHREDPILSFRMDLTFTGLRDPYDYYTEADDSEMAVISPLYDRHYEQPCAVTGEVSIGDRTYHVQGHGDRDHSWGTRRWVDIGSWDWFAVVFDDDTMVSCIEVDNASGTSVDGFLVADDETHAVTEMRMDRSVTERADDFAYRVTDAAGRELRGTAYVDGVLPIEFDAGDRTSEVRRCPTTFERESGARGHGWSDYQRNGGD